MLNWLCTAVVSALSVVTSVNDCSQQQSLLSSISLLPLLHCARDVDDAKCVVVSVCLSVCGRMPLLLHGPGCNLEERYGMPRNCALLGGFAISARVALLWEHSANTKCQRVLVLAPWLVYFCAFDEVMFTCLVSRLCLLFQTLCGYGLLTALKSLMVCLFMFYQCSAFTALTLLVQRQEEHPVCENIDRWGDVCLLSVWVTRSGWCHCRLIIS